MSTSPNDGLFAIHLKVESAKKKTHDGISRHTVITEYSQAMDLIFKETLPEDCERLHFAVAQAWLSEAPSNFDKDACSRCGKKDSRKKGFWVTFSRAYQRLWELPDDLPDSDEWSASIATKGDMVGLRKQLREEFAAFKIIIPILVGQMIVGGLLMQWIAAAYS